MKISDVRVRRSVNGDSDEPVRRSYEDLRSDAERQIAELERRLCGKPAGKPISSTPSPDSGISEDLMVHIPTLLITMGDGVMVWCKKGKGSV